MRMLKVSLLVALTVCALTSCNNDPDPVGPPERKVQYPSPSEFVNINKLEFRGKTYYYTDNPEKLSEEMPVNSYFSKDTVGVGGPVYLISVAGKELYYYPTGYRSFELLRMYSTRRKIFTLKIHRENSSDNIGVPQFKLVIKGNFGLYNSTDAMLTISEARIRVIQDKGGLPIELPELIGETLYAKLRTGVDINKTITLSFGNLKDLDRIGELNKYLMETDLIPHEGCILSLTFKDTKGNSFDETLRVNANMSNITISGIHGQD